MTDEQRPSAASPEALVDLCHDWLKWHSVERQDGDMLVPTSRAAAVALAAFVEKQRSEAAQHPADRAELERLREGRLSPLEREELEHRAPAAMPAAWEIQEDLDARNVSAFRVVGPWRQTRAAAHRDRCGDQSVAAVGGTGESPKGDTSPTVSSVRPSHAEDQPEYESPNFTPAALRELEARGFVRVNVPRRESPWNGGEK